MIRLNRRFSFTFIAALIIVSLFLGGCATSSMKTTMGNVFTTLGGNKGRDPLVEVETDLVLADELSAMIRMNQLILDRMPISYQDRWPELLLDYTSKKNKGTKSYDACLFNLLRRDFSYYRYYDPDKYLNYMINMGGSIGAIGSRMFISGCKDFGLRYEHAKLVVSYIPMGCKCQYFKRAYNEVSPKSRVCFLIKHSPVYKKCTFFRKPTEELLTRYILHSNQLGKWIDLPISKVCLRSVKGEQLGTFKQVFYSMLPLDLRYKIKRINDELEVDQVELETEKLRLEHDKKLKGAQRIAVQRKVSRLEGLVETKKALQKKLYNQAISQLNVTKENVEKAKKLLKVVKYVDAETSDMLGLLSNLVVKIVEDVDLLAQRKGAIIASYPTLERYGVLRINDKNYYARRASFLSTKIITLPISTFSVMGYAIAQRHQVGMYEDYIKAMIEAGKKLKNKKRGTL